MILTLADMIRYRRSKPNRYPEMTLHGTALIIAAVAVMVYAIIDCL
jgi:hypothetical protein